MYLIKNWPEKPAELQVIAFICRGCYRLGRECHGTNSQFTACTGRINKIQCPYCLNDIAEQVYPVNAICPHCNAKYYAFDKTWMQRTSIKQNRV